MSHIDELIKQDIHAYLDQHENKTLLKLLTSGSVDDGKSTLIGRLLHDSKLVYEDQLAAIKKNAKNSSDGEEFNLALLVDGLEAEREQGITIDVAYRYFSTSKRKFIIADTPGHEQYTRNMVTGASNSDLAIILIDARKGLTTQTKRHSFLVSLLGLKQVIVAVNKMDLVDYSKDIYDSIKGDYLRFAKDLDLTKIKFIPISALKGDNVVNYSEKMPWYEGNALLPFLEEVEIEAKEVKAGFQLPIQYVNRPNADFRGYSGTINQGSIAPGDPITVLPSGINTTVDRVISPDGDLPRAYTGMAITLTLTNEVDISRGDLLVHKDNNLSVKNQQKLRSHLVWMDQKPLQLDHDYELRLGPRRVNARVDLLHHRIDVNTMATVDSDGLGLNEIALVDIQLDALLPIEKFKNNQGLGAFILIDRITNATVAAGMISAQQADLIDHNHSGPNLEVANKDLKGASAENIVKWALGLDGKAVVTTNFGPQEAVLLNMVSQIAPETEVLWVDSGYNMSQTYKFADAVTTHLNLNLKVYTPTVSAARRDAVMGGIPMVNNPTHEAFTYQVKIEPFLRGMKEINASVWLTAVRREQTAFRQEMNTVTLGPNNVIKVSPLLDWTLADMRTYLEKHGLPDETHYFDPTKVDSGRECGLHTLTK